MFTKAEKDMLVFALISQKASLERSKSKARNPKMAPIYEEDLRLLAALTMKVQSLEEGNAQGKVASRP